MTIGSDGPGAVVLGAEDRAAALAEVKAMLRLVSDDEDALVAALAETALGLGEAFIGQVLIARTLRDVLPVSRAWQQLAATPVRAIGAVEAIGGAALASQAYAIDVDAAGDGWVRVIDAGGAIRVGVTFTAGLADGWGALPAPIRQGAVLLAAHLFTVRDAAAPPPVAVTALWRPFRRIALTRRTRAC
ncbi:hypothetical protein EWE75_21295 [Sphingomonas populi]|uniref:Phage gp6-like head-tail connector protein n=1 Tax=Sphingomonas populi TaxID=2484750 RepID=A0A4Q6XLC5_9SPHN|nr:hypothetical protein [Sphingomonas populi]RZF60753.1 hypothetical protein EWE75_21295 [Sphingomonas populi]